jgi:hypothetical protein
VSVGVTSSPSPPYPIGPRSATCACGRTMWGSSLERGQCFVCRLNEDKRRRTRCPRCGFGNVHRDCAQAQAMRKYRESSRVAKGEHRIHHGPFESYKTVDTYRVQLLRWGFTDPHVYANRKERCFYVYANEEVISTMKK